MSEFLALKDIIETQRQKNVSWARAIFEDLEARQDMIKYDFFFDDFFRREIMEAVAAAPEGTPELGEAYWADDGNEYAWADMTQELWDEFKLETARYFYAEVH